MPPNTFISSYDLRVHASQKRQNTKRFRVAEHKLRTDCLQTRGAWKVKYEEPAQAEDHAGTTLRRGRMRRRLGRFREKMRVALAAMAILTRLNEQQWQPHLDEEELLLQAACASFTGMWKMYYRPPPLDELPWDAAQRKYDMCVRIQWRHAAIYRQRLRAYLGYWEDKATRRAEPKKKRRLRRRKLKEAQEFVENDSDVEYLPKANVFVGQDWLNCYAAFLKFSKEIKERNLTTYGNKF